MLCSQENLIFITFGQFHVGFSLLLQEHFSPPPCLGNYQSSRTPESNQNEHNTTVCLLVTTFRVSFTTIAVPRKSVKRLYLENYFGFSIYKYICSRNINSLLFFFLTKYHRYYLRTKCTNMTVTKKITTSLQTLSWVEWKLQKGRKYF